MIRSKAPQHFSPEALNDLQAIYDEIAAMPWFPDHLEDREQLAVDIVDSYQNGLTDPAILRQFALENAHQHYVCRQKSATDNKSPV